MFAGFKFFVTFAVIGACAKDEHPRFVGPGGNVTAVEGREATLTCQVEHLHKHKVAWLRVDTQTILTIGPHVITKNHRVSVTKGDGQTWALTLREARPSDVGSYMCQINSEPMITQTHHLQVVVPPDIVDASSSGEAIVREQDNVTLHCEARGKPQPNITWRREDSTAMTVGGENVSKWSGAWLNLTSVTRAASGAFLCIATNGVPPSVSKRILLHVLCAPSVWAVQKMIGGYLDSSVLLQCKIEAYPTPMVYWTHIDKRVPNDEKYQANMKSEGYKQTATLLVGNVSREDIGLYRCHAENALGRATADITLYTLATSTTTTTTEATTTVEDTTITTVTYPEDGALDSHKDKFPDDDNYVVVLSQHQMQNLAELTPST